MHSQNPIFVLRPVPGNPDVFELQPIDQPQEPAKKPPPVLLKKTAAPQTPERAKTDKRTLKENFKTVATFASIGLFFLL